MLTPDRHSMLSNIIIHVATVFFEPELLPKNSPCSNLLNRICLTGRGWSEWYYQKECSEPKDRRSCFVCGPPNHDANAQEIIDITGNLVAVAQNCQRQGSHRSTAWYHIIICLADHGAYPSRHYRGRINKMTYISNDDSNVTIPRDEGLMETATRKILKSLSAYNLVQLVQVLVQRRTMTGGSNALTFAWEMKSWCAVWPIFSCSTKRISLEKGLSK